MTDLWAVTGFTPDGDVDDSGGTEPWGEDSMVPAPEQDVPGGPELAVRRWGTQSPGDSRFPGGAESLGGIEPPEGVEGGQDAEETGMARALEAPWARGRRRRAGRGTGTESGLSQVVAGNIRLEAARVGVTQAELARFLGMSRSAVSLRFTGKVDWRVGEVGQVAWYLNLPATDLFVRPRGARRDLSW
ncbi:XRE family transcriptional regulator [Actinomyces lilanjuaniae]|uniref:XRE family transcriptional regulator n=2 Tax=Actinomyces lilanjuaniae TaxID=2321394 RepID=A0ABM6Z3M5_9ACTO|nr:XRE family transcriptional regulator [Actinomyces lilanjuaniae]